MKVQALILLLATSSAVAQGTFQNLDFEQATVPPTPVNGSGDQVDPAVAFPGWTTSVVWTTNNPLASFYTLYRNLSLDSPAVDWIGPLFPNRLGVSSLQGSYSVVLQYSALFTAFPILSQIGLVPADARSIQFIVPSGTPWWQWPSVALNGVGIGLSPIGDGRLAGDVTAFAGTTTTLSFSTGTTFCEFDDIQFSPSSIPEPSALALFALPTALLTSRLLRGSRVRQQRYRLLFIGRHGFSRSRPRATSTPAASEKLGVAQMVRALCGRNRSSGLCLDAPNCQRLDRRLASFPAPAPQRAAIRTPRMGYRSSFTEATLALTAFFSTTRALKCHSPFGSINGW